MHGDIETNATKTYDSGQISAVSIVHMYIPIYSPPYAKTRVSSKDFSCPPSLPVSPSLVPRLPLILLGTAALRISFGRNFSWDSVRSQSLSLQTWQLLSPLPIKTPIYACSHNPDICQSSSLGQSYLWNSLVRKDGNSCSIVYHWRVLHKQEVKDN